jgi:hypothetical protein
MARRAGTEKTFDKTIISFDVASGVMVLVAPDVDKILSPKTVQVSSHGGGNLEYNILAGSDTILHGHVVSNSSDSFEWPDSYELSQGSGLYIESLAQDGSVTIYYTCYDESAGITKVAARAASLNPPLAIRTPNFLNGGDKS